MVVVVGKLKYQVTGHEQIPAHGILYQTTLVFKREITFKIKEK